MKYYSLPPKKKMSKRYLEKMVILRIFLHLNSSVFSGLAAITTI